MAFSGMLVWSQSPLLYNLAYLGVTLRSFVAYSEREGPNESLQIQGLPEVTLVVFSLLNELPCRMEFLNLEGNYYTTPAFFSYLSSYTCKLSY